MKRVFSLWVVTHCILKTDHFMTEFMVECSSPNSIHSILLAKLHIAAWKDEKTAKVHKWTQKQPAGNGSIL